MKPINTLFRIGLAWVTLLGMSMAETEQPGKVTEIELTDLSFSLPLPILNRMKISKLQDPEFREGLPKDMRGADIDDLSSSANANVYRAADGTTFCCDHLSMALWIRRGDSWECLLQGIRVNKTFGGMPPGLPVRYLGKGFFAFSQTAPVAEEQKPGDKFPVARAVTYLLDSKSGEVVARSEGFRYSENPPLRIPSEGQARIGVEPIPGN